MACEVVRAEVALTYGHTAEKAVEALSALEIRFSGMSREAVLEALRCRYDCAKKAAGRKRIAADLLFC